MLRNQRTSALMDNSLQEARWDNSGPELRPLIFAARVIFLRIAPPTFTVQTRVLFGNSKVPFSQQAVRRRMTRQNGVMHISGSAASWGAKGRSGGSALSR